MNKLRCSIFMIKITQVFISANNIELILLWQINGSIKSK